MVDGVRVCLELPEFFLGHLAELLFALRHVGIVLRRPVRPDDPVFVRLESGNLGQVVKSCPTNVFVLVKYLPLTVGVCGIVTPGRVGPGNFTPSPSQNRA